jgi:hypothetical protein
MMSTIFRLRKLSKLLPNLRMETDVPKQNACLFGTRLMRALAALET